MSFKLDWHPASIAKEWPRGSVVLVRYAKQRDSEFYNYNYWLAECFFPSFAQEGYEYLLLESPKQ